MGRQRSVNAGIIHPIAVMPCAPMDIDKGRKWSGALRLIDPSQPRPAGLALIFDIPLFYFVFSLVHHGGNLQPDGTALQVQKSPAGSKTFHLIRLGTSVSTAFLPAISFNSVIST